MTNEIKTLLDKIKNHPIFGAYPLYFTGGTALSAYLNHRVSYDIDFISTSKLPISAINTFAFSIGATPIEDNRASAFRINKGEDLANYHLKFMKDGVKMEFSYFNDPIIDTVLAQATFEYCEDNKTLKKLSLNDIVKLKTIALFARQKARDLFDMTIALKQGLISMEEVERIYAFKKRGGKTLSEYIQGFDNTKDDEDDASLDFLPTHEYYQTFAKLTQDERFDKCKKMFLTHYDIKQKEKLEKKKREVASGLRRNKQGR